MKQIIFIILLCLSCNTIIISQNLDSMPVALRDSILIYTAKEAILKYGPDYYREYKQPVISYRKFPSADQISDARFLKYAGRYYYEITFLYDPAEETLEWDFTAKARIWADTGDLDGVSFGNGYGRLIPEDMDWRNDTTIGPVPYQESTVPIYGIISIEIPDSIVEEQAREEYVQQAMKNLNPEPVNKDVLIRKGFERRSDGQWVKTRPDTPPAEALQVIQRAKAMMKMDNR